MTREDSFGCGVHLSAIGDVAELVLGSDFLRNGPQALLAARQEHALPAVGRESAGVPPLVHEAADARLTIPMPGGGRSLNLAVAVAMAAGEAIRQVG